MAKTRKCRMPADELEIHEEAVRLRKMTDKQLIEELQKAEEKGAERALTAQKQKAGKDTSGLEKLISALYEGKCKGIRDANTYKIAELAREMGLLK